MERIKIVYDECRLQLVVKILEVALLALPKTQQETKNYAIALQLRKKLRKKLIDRAFKLGEFKVSYEVYEAIVFEEILRANFDFCTTEYQRNTVRMITDEINQKTA